MITGITERRPRQPLRRYHHPHPGCPGPTQARTGRDEGSIICLFLNTFSVSHNTQANSSGRVRPPRTRKVIKSGERYSQIASAAADALIQMITSLRKVVLIANPLFKVCFTPAQRIECERVSQIPIPRLHRIPVMMGKSQMK